MPNHVIHVVTFSHRGNEILDMMKGENGFDFNQILPAPKELSDFRSPPVIVSEVQYEEEVFLKAERESRGLSSMGLPMTQEIHDRLMAQYGSADWYSWNCEHWATKWNAYEVKRTGDSVMFQTAWSTPVPVFEALSAKYPDVSITVEHADEDIGFNCGKSLFRGGKVEKLEQYGVLEAKRLWSYIPSDIDKKEELIRMRSELMGLIGKCDDEKISELYALLFP